MADPVNSLALFLGIPVWLLVIVVLWALVWKGIALWKSARRNELIWFLVLLIINTLGVLEILYIYVFSQLSPKKNGNGTRKRKK